ncbi:MAG TPA: hybrid sensor histidine kinase/response regulator [Bacteroidales bacterium]|jgi:signal transduction histidine kinase|nr:hybrid sensor histidine kinase/response regulator [Bacteroidales bacterium]HRR48355.1 hybrid sensor histidine kinase/response regulator [Bacteroidales bacterium]HRT33065.1 hybrid sensor histidine kinase/response regulator [Bacteroidales bacterium]HRT83216.1 hybrid sensor histidine kinase/response regulator [Bacteroidales bacterium]
MNNIDFKDGYIPDILIVDDMPANLVLLGHILKNVGYKVRPVPNGQLALKVAEKEKPDLIFLDIMMPEMDGFEVCRKFKENPDLNDIPIIFISALNDTENIVKALNSGGSDYITKPFKAEEVRARAATHIKLYLQAKELLKANAEKNKFFSIIAHDLKSPFSNFLAVTQTLEEMLPQLTTDEIRSFASSMHKSATILYRLLENLLQWSRIQRGLITYEPREFQINSLITESVSMYKDTAKNKEIEISLYVPENLKAYADVNMLQTVVRNLLSNSIKFTPRGGKIFINAKTLDEEYIEISIRDTGIGMPPAIADNLFRIDVKTNRDGTEGEPSTGLGLLLCKEFVEKNKGKIYLESEENAGTTFHFTVVGTVQNFV